MRNFILGVLLAAFIALGIHYFMTQVRNQKTELASSDLILNQLKNVGKLIVTEGHFSEVITYKDAKKFYLDILTAEKKAIVVVNASVTIGYDLSKVSHDVHTDTKTVTITHIPEAEVTINPKIKYHDLEEDFLNQFTPHDHNLIQQEITRQLTKKIEASTLKSNAENRLISELQKIYILTNSLGWKLIYNGNIVRHTDQLVTKKIQP